MRHLLLLTAILLVLAKAGWTQRSLAELPALASEMQLDLVLRSLDDLEFDSTGGLGHQPYHLAWRHRRGHFELRYELLPENRTTTLAPHVLAGARATHNAANAAEDFIGRFRGGTEDLQRLGATWAYFWDYTPQPSIGAWRRCYQASYYRPGRGLVTAWLLYNDPKYLHSDWVYVLPFREAQR